MPEFPLESDQIIKLNKLLNYVGTIFDKILPLFGENCDYVKKAAMIVREYAVKVNNQSFYCERDLWVQLFGEIGSDGL